MGGWGGGHGLLCSAKAQNERRLDEVQIRHHRKWLYVMLRVRVRVLMFGLGLGMYYTLESCRNFWTDVQT